MVTLIGPKKTKSSWLDINSKAAKYLLNAGWKAFETVTLDDTANVQHDNNHSEMQQSPEVTVEVPEAYRLQHKELVLLNFGLTQKTIELLVNAKLDSPEALQKSWDQDLINLGIKRTEIRKIRRYLHTLVKAEDENEETDAVSE